MARANRSSFLGRYSVVMAGVILLFAGFAALGWWLAAAGSHAGHQVVATGVAAAVCFAMGLLLLTLAYRHRQGMFQWRPSRREEETYRDEYRR